MTKQEFLEQLRRSLTTRAGSAVASENVSYYEEYIATQVRAGRTEEEVIRGLGDPRLLARSIAEAQERAGSIETAEDEEDIYQEDRGFHTRRLRMPGWLIALLVFIVVFWILGVVFSVLRILFPILFPIFLIVFFLQIIQKR